MDVWERAASAEAELSHRLRAAPPLYREGRGGASADKLWYQYLRSYPLPFTRQRMVAHRFIADFCCARAGLVIELDGSQHFTPDGRRYAAIRTEDIGKYHLQVLRFTNPQIDREFPAVCPLINSTVHDRMAP